MRNSTALSVVLAAALSLPAGAATGFITTRPTCAPPKYTRDALNYLQAPEPILLDSGDVAMLVGTGRCCGMHHWEGIYSLTYPAEGRAAVPRFHPLWATNDFNSQPRRKEAEVGFASALFYNGQWRLALTTTFLPFHTSDRDRVGRIDLPSLTTRATPAQVNNNWLSPIDPKCRGIASCAGDGSGLDSVLTMHPNGDLYIYHRDGNYPACPSGYVRHHVASNLTVLSSVVDGCVQFSGLARAPFLVSEIARRADGSMSLLAGGDLRTIEEWTSTGDAAHIGLAWQRSGRTWTAPQHSQSGWTYYVRDAAFLKDESRTVIEPTVVVANISDGRSFDELSNVQLGRMYLYYWAEDGAPLPPSFGGPADACAYEGTVEAADCSTVRGWAWDPKFPNAPVSVDLLADGKVVGTVAADAARPDLHRGDGRHGFAWTVPPSLRDGRRHKLSARFAETTDGLAGKTATLICP